MPNFISFTALIAELAHGKNHVVIHSINRAAYLMGREPKLLLRNLVFSVT